MYPQFPPSEIKTDPSLASDGSELSQPLEKSIKKPVPISGQSTVSDTLRSLLLGSASRASVLDRSSQMPARHSTSWSTVTRELIT
jgi:hypothetical protein